MSKNGSALISQNKFEKQTKIFFFLPNVIKDNQQINTHNLFVSSIFEMITTNQ